MPESAVKPLIYLDSMVFIYAVEGGDATARPARQFFDWVRRYPGAALTSELSLAEVLVTPKRMRDDRIADAGLIPAHTRRSLYLSMMVASRFLLLSPVTRDLLLETADLRDAIPHKLPDAIHLVTAMRYDCKFFVSADTRIRVPGTITKIEPTQAGIAELLEALA